MLTPDAAKSFLSQWRVNDEPADEFSDHGAITRFKPAIGKLPAALRKVAFGIWGLNEEGGLPEGDDGPIRYGQLAPAWKDFLSLPEREQAKVLAIPFPAMSAAVAHALSWLTRAPYQGGYDKQAFRVPGDRLLARRSQVRLLEAILHVAEQYDEKVVTVEWLAIWAPYVKFRWSTIEAAIVPLLAATIDRDDKAGRTVFDLLLACGRQEHEHGGMGRHVIGGLLAANRPEGWEFVEKLLLAAQRQEGLRQSVLESVDLSHPQAFLRTLKLIRSENLARFSAVARALNVWLGYQWDSVAAGVINKIIDRLIELLEKPKKREQAAAGQEPELAYLALWSWAITDVKDALAPAARMLRSKDAALRFAAVTFLGSVKYGALTRRHLVPLLDDVDLRIAVSAMRAVVGDDSNEAADLSKSERAAIFDGLRRLVDRLPAKPAKQEPLVWPWSVVLLNQEEAAENLVNSRSSQPLKAILPYVRLMSPYRRAQFLEHLSKQKSVDPITVDEFVGSLGDASQVVRTAASHALQGVVLSNDQRQILEGYLTRKSADLRSAVQSLLAAGNSKDALTSVDRLLIASQAAQRLGGLEILRELASTADDPAECIARAKSYRAAARRLSRDEIVQLDAIDKAAVRGPKPSRGYGLFNPDERSKPMAPKNRKAKLWTPAAEAIVRSLDDLVHQHRESVVTVGLSTQPLGTMTWGFPTPQTRSVKPPQLPLREVWEKWLKERPAKLRDRDGYEFLRADMYFDLVEQYSSGDELKWLKAPHRKAIAALLPTAKLGLRYGRIVESLLSWFCVMEPPKSPGLFFVDCFETLCSLLSEADIQSLDPMKGKRVDLNRYAWAGLTQQWDETALIEDWRHHSPLAVWHRRLHFSFAEMSDDSELARRLWGLACWWDRPIPEAYREPISVHLCCHATEQGLANEHDLYDQLLIAAGPYSSGGSPLLQTLTARKTDRPVQKLLKRPDVRNVVDQTIRLIVETELARGEQTTILTAEAHQLDVLRGVDWLVRILTALGKDGFKLAASYMHDLSRRATLTRLASKTFPAESETVEYCTTQFRQAVKDGLVTEDRLIQLAFLAPQWVRTLEVYFGWPGMAEAIYWFLAHMGFLWGSDVAERAAEGATDETKGTVEQDEPEDGEQGHLWLTREEQLGSWNRMLAERSPITEAERAEGAIDTRWFQEVYSRLGAKQWDRIAAAARFASNAGQAKKAQTIADVLLGKTSADEIIAGIEKKQLKDHVRLLGLAPLPKGAKRTAELHKRFRALSEYQRYARKLSGLTRPQAMRALEIGLKNLAQTAGYADPMRLEWALGAEDLNDLAKGPVSVEHQGVRVTLAIEKGLPAVSAIKGGKPLASVPAAIKKADRIADLYERSKDLKRQASRLKSSLEAAMCRGEQFSADELQQLFQHPLMFPLIERLVLVGDGILGYPEKGGRALRDYQGHLEPVKKQEMLRLAHPFDLWKAGSWSEWQRECFQAERIQPFKQVFRELYVPTKQELSNVTRSTRFAAHQINPQQAMALWTTRGWSTAEGVFKTFHDLGITANVGFRDGSFTPLEVEGLTLEEIRFFKRGDLSADGLNIADVPPNVFSEVMRDCDLVVSVAHRGGVDPEASESTVEMRSSLVRETSQLMDLKNVRLKSNHVFVDGHFGSYSIHLGSGGVHRLPGGSLCIVPVHAQHRGRIFLPFADDDPKTAEIVSKVVLLARDHEIQDPGILEQLRT